MNNYNYVCNRRKQENMLTIKIKRLQLLFVKQILQHMKANTFLVDFRKRGGEKGSKREERSQETFQR